MRSRKYTKRVEIYQLTRVADGFGGFTVTDAKIGESWAKLETFQAGKALNLAEYGIINPQRSILFTLRLRNDITYNVDTQYIKYRNKKYIISSYPTNINFEDSEITFIGTEEKTKSNTTV